MLKDLDGYTECEECGTVHRQILQCGVCYLERKFNSIKKALET